MMEQQLLQVLREVLREHVVLVSQPRLVVPECHECMCCCLLGACLQEC